MSSQEVGPERNGEPDLTDVMERLDQIHGLLERRRAPREFPEAREDQSVRLTRQKSFGAWAGRPERLGRIAEEVETALRSAFQEWKAADEKRPQEQRRLIATEAWRSEVVVLGAGGKVRRTGAMAAILAEMDLRDIEGITIGNGSRYVYPLRDTVPQVAVSFGIPDRLRMGPPYTEANGVTISVAGSDRQWVGGIFDTLTNEVRKDVPWWAPARTGRGAFLSVLAIAVALASLPIYVLERQGAAMPPAGMFAGLAALLLSFLLVTTAGPRVLPQLEVLESGDSPTLKRVAAATATVLGITLAAAGLIATLVAPGTS
jgi:hypothetical protein